MLLSTRSTIRRFGIRHATFSALQFERNGHPTEVLKMTSQNLPDVKAGEVLMRVLAAPINPADFDSIAGTYGKKAALPGIGGLEGVGVVEKVGSGVSLKVGQRVIPSKPGFGMWRTAGVVSEKDVIAVSNDIPVEYAATISVNPCTAYRLLNDFVKLSKGDVVVQNGANSVVGQAVIQLAKQRGIKTINIVRNGALVDDTIEHLKALGGDIVVDDEFAATAEVRKMVKELAPAKLALNCIGGSIGTETARLLGDGGKFVTYGGMSRQPLVVPVSHQIFRDISLHGFWMTQWVEKNPEAKRVEMLREIEDLIKAQKLTFLYERVAFDQWASALQKSTDPVNKRKIVLTMGN